MLKCFHCEEPVKCSSLLKINGIFIVEINLCRECQRREKEILLKAIIYDFEKRGENPKEYCDLLNDVEKNKRSIYDVHNLIAKRYERKICNIL
jgi:hypothetical protein